LIYPLICIQVTFAFEVSHGRGRYRALYRLALIQHCEINNHPIEVVAQYCASLQRHCNPPIAQSWPVRPQVSQDDETHFVSFDLLIGAGEAGERSATLPRRREVFDKVKIQRGKTTTSRQLCTA
jgi:hypothetical protein